MPVLISLSPNTEADDVWAALWRLFTPWTWRQEKYMASAAQKLRDHFPGQAVSLTSSGRAALADAVRLLEPAIGDEVIVQAFTCLAVPQAIKVAGATPVFADIDENTYNLTPDSVRARITPRTRAIVVQHTFGIPAEIEELAALAAEHDLVLIEDCAHGLGGSVADKKLGAFGDLTVLSFGRDKTISTIFGGALLTRSKKFTATLPILEQAKDLPPSWWVAQQLLHPLIISLVKPFYFSGGLGKVLLILAQRLRLLSFAVTPAEKVGGTAPFMSWRFSPALASLLPRQLDKLERFTRLRQEHAEAYGNELRAENQAAPEPNWLRFPWRVTRPSEVLKRARQNKLFLGDWYQQAVFPSANAAVSGYQPGSCPVAEKAAQEIINLPTYPTLTVVERQRVIDFIKSL